MRFRRFAAVFAALSIALAGCASTESGTAVTGEGGPVKSSAESTDSSNTEETDDGGTSTEDSATEETASDEKSTDEKSTEEQSTEETETASSQETVSASSAASTPPSSSGAETSTTAGSGDKPDSFPTDICKLMPTGAIEGLEKSDGNPNIRCMYSGMKGGKYRSVTLGTGSGKDLDPVHGNAKNPKELKIAGRDALVYSFTSGGDRVTAWINLRLKGSERDILYLHFSDETLNEAAAVKAAVEIMNQAAPKLAGVSGGDAPVTSAPPTLGEERAWPEDLCSLLPKSPVPGLERTPGYESTRCLYEGEDGEQPTDIRITQDRLGSFDPKDPSDGFGKDVKQVSFDGRKAWTWTQTSGDSAHVLFLTSAKEAAHVSVFRPLADKAETMKMAVEVASTIAPHLPKG